MSRYDGTPEPLTYAEALVAIATKLGGGWVSDEERDEAVNAIKKEHGIAIVAATPIYQDARDQTISQYEAELAEARAWKAQKLQAERDAADLAELEELRRERDLATVGVGQGEQVRPGRPGIPVTQL